MANEFEPYDKQLNVVEFNAWEYKETNEKASVEEEQEALLSELEKIRQTAHQEGYEKGIQQAQEEINAIKKDLLNCIDLLQKPTHILDEQITQEIIQTVIWLCKQSIAVELTMNPEKLHALFERIKKELPSLHGKRVLKMHPDDMIWMKANFSHKEFEGIQEILDADPLLSRGDFYLQGNHSELDGRIETRLSTIFEQFITSEKLITKDNSGTTTNE